MKMKRKLKEKYLPDSYKHRLLDKLHSLRQESSENTPRGGVNRC